MSSEQIDDMMMLFEELDIQVVEKPSQYEPPEKDTSDGKKLRAENKGGEKKKKRAETSPRATTRCACTCARWGRSLS